MWSWPIGRPVVDPPTPLGPREQEVTGHEGQHQNHDHGDQRHPQHASMLARIRPNETPRSVSHLDAARSSPRREGRLSDP